MSRRIVVDPITRIEGHLRIDVEVDGGKVTKSWSSGQSQSSSTSPAIVQNRPVASKRVTSRTPDRPSAIAANVGVPRRVIVLHGNDSR